MWTIWRPPRAAHPRGALRLVGKSQHHPAFDFAGCAGDRSRVDVLDAILDEDRVQLALAGEGQGFLQVLTPCGC
jgi:hypothetical protein